MSESVTSARRDDVSVMPAAVVRTTSSRSWPIIALAPTIQSRSGRVSARVVAAVPHPPSTPAAMEALTASAAARVRCTQGWSRRAGTPVKAA